MKINLIVGEKGSGKTKRLTELINQRAIYSNGSVVCIEKGDVSTFTVSHKVRLIDTDDCKIQGVNQLYGLIAGVLESNYDITDIFVDATFRIIGEKDINLLLELLKRIKENLNYDAELTFTVSCSPLLLTPDIFEKIAKVL